MAVELANRFITQNKPLECIFIAAEAPPDITDFKRNPMQFNEHKIADVLRHYGGTPQDVLDDIDFRSVFFPIIRNELSINFYMKQALLDKKIDFPLVLIHGNQDRTASRANMEVWARFTHSQISLHTVSSDHFFINHLPKDVATIINSLLP